MISYEVNFDGIVGQTHNYAGLSSGNIASTSNANEKSFPKQAVKQGLDKMKYVRDLGLKQGVLAPQQRPDLSILRQLGFSGTDAQVIEKSFKSAPHLLNACYSASSMWTANAATVSPSADTKDRKVHFTPANLVNKFHRSIEHKTTGKILKAMFPNNQYFSHHEALPTGNFFGDEGAANHTRLCSDYGDTGVEFFVYGRHFNDQIGPKTKIFEARQSYEASMAIARLHQLDPAKTIFAQQNPEIIDQGVFHNDVIGVGNKNTYFFHELSFVNQIKFEQDLKKIFPNDEINLVKVSTKDVPLKDAISSYLFNSQLITLPNKETALIAPLECKTNKAVFHYIENILTKESPIQTVHYLDVTQSMKNGGGPACLRLRVALNENEIQAMNQSVLLTDDLYQRLHTWADKHYRDELCQNDLADPHLIIEVQTALDELTQILNLGAIYPFQKNKIS